MNLTTQQVANILKCSTSHIYSLVKQGKLAYASDKGHGKHKSFDSVAIKEAKKTLVRTKNWGLKRHRRVVADSPVVHTPIHSFGSRLDRIEAAIVKLEKKVDNLVKIWS